MKSEELDAIRKAYKEFFESPAGVFMTEQINKLIDFNHEAAELKPELSRDHTQRAKGNREVLTHIQIILNGVKKVTNRENGVRK